MQIDKKGKVQLRHRGPNRKLDVKVFASVARETLSREKCEYITDADYRAQKADARLEAAVDKRLQDEKDIREAEERGLVPAEDAPIVEEVEVDLIAEEASIDDNPAADILAAHASVLGMAEEGDERLTPTGCVKKSVLFEIIDRPLDQAEFLSYTKWVKANAPA